MARDIRAEQIEGVARPVVSVGNDYPNKHQHPRHRHRRDQLLFAERGTMLVQTDDGAWVVPTSQGIWIPAGTMHGMTMLGNVATRSVYLDPAVAGSMPQQCQVLGIGHLLRQLLIEAVDLPSNYDADSRAGKIMSLLVDELAIAPILPLNLPLPRNDERLAARCRRFVKRPTMLDTIDTWCRDLALNRRTFTRRFRRETGLSFAEWQRRACLVATLPRLMQGDLVTTVAFDLGYSSPGAFTTMFKRVLGAAPSAYRQAKVGSMADNEQSRPASLVY